MCRTLRNVFRTCVRLRSYCLDLPPFLHCLPTPFRGMQRTIFCLRTAQRPGALQRTACLSPACLLSTDYCLLVSGSAAAGYRTTRWDILCLYTTTTWPPLLLRLHFFLLLLPSVISCLHRRLRAAAVRMLTALYFCAPHLALRRMPFARIRRTITAVPFSLLPAWRVVDGIIRRQTLVWRILPTHLYAAIAPYAAFIFFCFLFMGSAGFAARTAAALADNNLPHATALRKDLKFNAL